MVKVLKDRDQVRSKLRRLLDESDEKYYWLGFLLADGHFSKINRLKVELSSKDIDYLDRFRVFLDDSRINLQQNTTKEGYKTCAISVMDTKVISELKTKFKIASNKTIEPPNLSSLNKRQLFCLSVGFIDGDGCIQNQTGRTDCQLSVKCHRSWLPILRLLYGSAKIDARGYAIHMNTDNEKLRKIKRKAIKLNLPIMVRKWSKIDIERVSRYRQKILWNKLAFELKEQGLSQKEIALRLLKSKAAISKLFKENSGVEG